MNSKTQDNSARCTLCPALCELGLGWRGPDLPRVEYAKAAGAGLCPRGAALGELLASPRRIRWPRRRRDGGLEDIQLAEAVAAAAERMAAGATVLIDGAALPLEQIAAAAEIAAAWDGVRICGVLPGEDEQTLLGTEASGATYLADEDLSRCDGFVIVGDAFAANPRCARGVLDAVRAGRRVPVVVIDSGGGVSGGFATLRIDCPAGGELEALGAEAVAKAVEPCAKLAVLIAPDPGRGGGWGRLGYLAGKLANDHRGGVAVQTTGGNALAVLRARKQLGLLSPAEAMTPSKATELRVALGVDILGVLGWDGPAAGIAAAALPNRTTEPAELILPLALPCELGGTVVEAGTRPVKVSPLLRPPAGVPAPAELLGMIAAAAGVDVKPRSGPLPKLDRLAVGTPAEVPPASEAGRMLVGARDPIHHSAGELTGLASWQGQLRDLPELRLSPADAAELGVADLDEVEVQTDSARTRMRARVVRHMAAGTLAASQGCGQARRATPYQIDADRDALISPPADVQEVKRVSAGGGRKELELRFV